MKFTDVSHKLPESTKHSFIHFRCDQQEQLLFTLILTLLVLFFGVMILNFRSTEQMNCLFEFKFQRYA